ncbi:MAG TPA: FAD-dependent oxidoreductase [Nitrososphaerales archaeon]|nr:FAD-dependent oxidoreductase [Nitrososphaerales archaeon]
MAKVRGSTVIDRSTPRAAQSGILVIGAGLAGLTLALALARKGIKTTVIEKQTEITASKWAILLYPIGMKIFQDLGVLEEIKEPGDAAEGLPSRHRRREDLGNNSRRPSAQGPRLLSWHRTIGNPNGSQEARAGVGGRAT